MIQVFKRDRFLIYLIWAKLCRVRGKKYPCALSIHSLMRRPSFKQPFVGLQALNIIGLREIRMAE
jgi:hypothetical protein